MNETGGLPYIEAQFDEHGLIKGGGTIHVPDGTTKLLVTSHGRGDSLVDARQFYQKFFDNFVRGGRTQTLEGCAVLGLIWPSKGVELSYAGDKTVKSIWAEMKNVFSAPDEQRVLHEASALLPQLESKATARVEFANKIRSLLDPLAIERGISAKVFFNEDGDSLLRLLQYDPDWKLHPAAEHSDLSRAVQKFLEFALFLEYRARAERVGRNGVAKLIDELATELQSVHLIGHSFGGYTVAAAAAESHTDRLASMSLLQTPISRSSFSKDAGGFFRSIIDQNRVKGPILATYAQSDDVVDLAYPIAKRLSGVTSSGFGDESERFGALGRYGLRGMAGEEVINRTLFPGASKHSFAGSKLINLDVTQSAKAQPDVTSNEIAQAVRSTVELGSSLVGPDTIPPAKKSRKPKPVFLGFSVPRHAKPGVNFAARFAAYIDSARKEVEQQLKALGDQGDRIISDVPPDSAPNWIVGAPITVRLAGDNVKVESPERSFEWNGRSNVVSFVVRAGETSEPRIQLRFQVFLGPVEIAFVPLNVDLVSGVENTTTKTQTRRSPRSAFASYASKDSTLVGQKLSALIRFAPSLDIFQDALDLRPGEEFKPEIEQEISKREAFFLFWSRNARASKWVNWELETALSKRGKEAVTLMPLEDPAIVEPPPGFESQQQRDRFLFAAYAFQKVREIAATETPGEGG